MECLKNVRNRGRSLLEEELRGEFGARWWRLRIKRRVCRKDKGKGEGERRSV